MTEDFEGTFPSGKWDSKVNTGGARYKWGKDNYRANSGSYSAWVAAVPTSGASPLPDHYYPSNMNTGMAYGPFSLEGASAARLRFKMWIDVESNKDDFGILATTDINGGWDGLAFSGVNKSWQDVTLDFSDVGQDHEDFLGEPTVYIAFLFRSDGNANTQYEGVFIDDVVLEIQREVEACYSLNVSKDPEVGGEVEILTEPNCSDGSGKYRSGTDIYLYASANTGYRFTGWSGDFTGSGDTANFKITKDTNVTAHFESVAPPVCYTLTVNQPAEGGSIQVKTAPNCPNQGETNKYLSGTVVHLAATAAEGYSFSGWTGASGTQSDGTVTMDTNKSVSASFTRICYALEYHADPQAGGTITVNPLPNCNDKYTYGTKVTLTATPSAGYRFSSWTGATAKPGQPNQAEVTMNSAKNVTAYFEKDCYKLTVTTNPSGAGSVSQNPGPNCGADSYHNGTVVTLTATANPGYSFKSWTGAEPQTEPHVTKVTINAAKEVTANFETVCYALETAVDPAGTGTVKVNTTPNCGQDKYTHGTKVSVTAEPGVGNEFTSWTGADESDKATTTVTMTANKKVTANFKKACFTLTTEIDPVNGGTVTVQTSANCDASKYEYGTDVTVSASPSQGYSFDRWSGDASGTATQVTVKMTSNKTVTAHFTKDAVCYSLGITVDPASSGTVSKELAFGADCGGGKYEEGSQVKLTAIPAGGYAFSSWSGDASGTTTQVTVTMTGNKTVTARFARVCYSLDVSVSPASAGSVTANPESSQACGENKYESGTVVTLTASPADGYVFSKWEGDASGTGAQIQVTMNGNKAITAVFTQAPPVCYTLTVNVNPKEGGTVKVETPPDCGQNMYKVGTKVKLTATANKGYVFKTWSGDTTSTNSNVELTMSKNQSVTAVFEKQQAVKHLLYMPILRRP
ncbi:MAG: hypothetical protein GX491_05530 [Chloroflexi bacterium]|nr:hypothetical protein [Chloroflexota bacterium]